MNRSRSALGFVGVFIAFWALIIASIAVAVANNNDSSSASDSSSAPIAVNLSEFAITPNHLSAKPGNVTLQVTNAGSGIHNLALKGADATTADLNAGEGATLDLGELDAGEYTLYCTIPGHESAGMSAMLMVDENATSTVAASAPMTAEEMDEIMKAVTLRFPEETAGLGAQVMEPDILADGTKQFDLTASVVDWEVEGGKTVKAFAYNGVVPGPTIKVDVGDKVRLVLHNEMTESTSIHFHGIRVPNEYDGVPDITQEPVKPGESFVYEFTTKEPAVGIYHSHHNAQVQVPNGLFAAFLVGDMPVPDDAEVDGEYVMVLNDAGTIGYSLNGKSFPATAPYVVEQGRSIIVHYLNEGLQSHPMHLHGPDTLVIAKDGVPLETPWRQDTVNVAPGERYTILVTGEDPGVWAWHCHILTHAESPTGMFGMVTALIVQ